MKILCAFVLLFLNFSLPAQDYPIIDETYSKTIFLSSNESFKLDFDSYFYVEKIIVSGEGIGKDSMIEVLVDNKVKGTIYFPGRDPDYIVTIREVTKSLEFRHLNGAKAKISGIKVFRSESGYESGGGNLLGKFYLMNFSKQFIEYSRILEEKIPTKDFERNILPSKIAAGNLFAVASARGDVSLKSMEKYQALYFTMTLSIPYIDTLLSHAATFDLALKYLSLYEEIKDRLD